MNINLLSDSSFRFARLARSLFLPIVVIGVIGPSSLVRADGMDGGSACEGTARKMFTACRAEKRDDFFTDLANCQNIGDADARSECRDDARATRIEELQLCGAQKGAREDACELLGENRFDPDPLLDPNIMFVNPEDINEGNANTFFSLVPGSILVSRTGLEQDEVDVVFVTDEVREISGQLCRIVADVAAEEEEVGPDEFEYTIVEATDDSYLQDLSGSVYYCGEISRSFEDGVLRELEGSFESGIDSAKGGILMRAMPMPGDIDRQEF